MLDGDANEVEAEVLYLPFYRLYWNLEERTWGDIFPVSPDGYVSTVRPGEYPVLVRVVGTAHDASMRDSDAGDYLQRRVPLTILPRPPASIALNAPGPFHAGTEVTLEATPLDDNGAFADDVEIEWRTSNASTAMPIGQPPANQRITCREVLALGAPGRVAITATTGGATSETTLHVAPNPAPRISLTRDRSAVQTGGRDALDHHEVGWL